jgi:type IV pilus biogenesis protein CpaD/CtpE
VFKAINSEEYNMTQQNKLIVAFMAFMAAVTTGCTLSQTATIDPDLGAAVQHNIAIQTINPGAGPPDDSTTMDGQKVQQAIEAYREGGKPITSDSLIQNVGGN